MADVNTPDASVATNASNQTQYFNLPLFIATDKPSWLVDWNGAMNEIDNILNDIATASEGAVADVTTIQTQVNTLSTTVTSLNNVVEEAVEDVAAMQTTVDSHDTRMDTIEGDLITQNNLIKALSTSVTTMQGTVASLNTAVETMQTTLAGYDTRIETAEDAAAAAQTAVAGIQTTVQGLSNTVSGHTTTINQHTSQISSLGDRVTALEQGGTGGGVPVITDLNWTETSKAWSDITSTRVTLARPSVDSYVFVDMEIGSISGLTTTVNTGQFTINGGIPLLKMAQENSTNGFRQNAVSGVVKVAANQEIYLLSPNWTTNTVTEGMSIFSITVHMANA